MKKKSEINIKYNKVLINLQSIESIQKPTPTLNTPTTLTKSSKGLLAGINDKKKISLVKTGTKKDNSLFQSVWSDSKNATIKSSK